MPTRRPKDTGRQKSNRTERRISEKSLRKVVTVKEEGRLDGRAPGGTVPRLNGVQWR